jgi:hypothetical protein
LEIISEATVFAISSKEKKVEGEVSDPNRLGVNTLYVSKKETWFSHIFAFNGKPWRKTKVGFIDFSFV